MTGRFEEVAFPILPDGRVRAAALLRAAVAERYFTRLRALECLIEALEPGFLAATGLAGLLRFFRRLPRAVRREALLAPAMSRWLFTVGNRLPYSGPLRGPERRLIERASHALVPGLIRAGSLGPQPFSLWTDEAGDIRFPGARFKIALGRRAARGRVTARSAGGRLALRAGGLRAPVSVALPTLRRALLGRARPAGALVPDERYDGDSQMLFDGGEPLLRETLAQTTLENRLFTERRLGALPCARSLQKQAVRDALQTLRRVWPAQHAEVLAYTRQIIPVDGARHLNGTLTHLQGAIFFAGRGQRWQNVEFIIHEAAHLKLNLITELYPLLGGEDRYYLSPWSRIPRLSSVLLQAGYIYLLVGLGLERALEAEGRQRQAVKARMRHIARGFPPFFRLVERRIPLTGEGRAFVAEYRRHALAAASRLESA